MNKVKVKDANGNGRLDWFDVLVHYGTITANVIILTAGLIQNVI